MPLLIKMIFTSDSELIRAVKGNQIEQLEKHLERCFETYTVLPEIDKQPISIVLECEKVTVEQY